MGDFLSGVLGTQNSVQTGQSQPIGTLSYNQQINQGNQNYNQTYQSQMALAQALQNQMQGKGPNPAISMLQNAQSQNAQQAAGVYANNRAINPALAARQASMLQGQMGAQSANQAASLTAQQQLAATQNLGGLYGQVGQQNNQYLGVQQGALAAQNQAINASNAVNAGIATGNQQVSAGLVGGLIGAAGSAAQMGGGGKYSGGMIHNYDDGGMVSKNGLQSFASNGPTSFAGKYLSGISNAYSDMPVAQSAGDMGALGRPITKVFNPMDKVTNPNSSITGINSSVPVNNFQPSGPQMPQYSMGGMASYLGGGQVPGQAMVQGDNPQNDTVPAMVSPGEVVIPRSIMMSKDAPNKARDFVAAVMAKEKYKR